MGDLYLTTKAEEIIVVCKKSSIDPKDNSDNNTIFNDNVNVSIKNKEWVCDRVDLQIGQGTSVTSTRTKRTASSDEPSGSDCVASRAACGESLLLRFGFHSTVHPSLFQDPSSHLN